MDKYMVKLMKVADLQGGFAFKSKDFTPSGTPLLRIGEISKGKIKFNEKSVYVSNEYLESHRKYCLKKDDILIALSGATTGKYAVYDLEDRVLLNQRVLRIRSSENVDSKYLFYCMSLLKKIIQYKAAGVAQPNISPLDISELKIPLPPLQTQKKIVQALDKAQELIDLRKKQIELLDELIQSVFYDMFGDPQINARGIEIKQLTDITTKITDGVHSKPEYTTKGIPFISVKDIGTGKVIFDNCKFISEKAHNEYYKRCNPELGDILYTKVGARYGIPAVVETNAEFSLYVSVALIKPKKNLINSVFLREALKILYVYRQAVRSIKGIGVPDLHLVEIRKLNIPVPPKNEQNKFELRVRRIEQQKQLMEESLTEMENNFNSLMQKAFKGELFG